jgi:hypothetical protein
MIRPGGGNHESCLQWRDTPGGGAAWPDGSLVPAPLVPNGYWIRGLYMEGEFTGYFAPGNDQGDPPAPEEWVLATGGPHALNADGQDTILAGLAVTSHDDAALVTANFSEIQIFELGAGGVENLAATFAGDNVELTWEVSGDPEEIRISRSIVGPGEILEELDTIGGDDTSYTDTGLPASAIVVAYMVKPVVQGILLSGQSVLAVRSGYTAFQDGVLPTPDYDGTQDAHIIYYRSDQDEWNTGGHNFIEEGDWNVDFSDPKEALVQFDLLDVTTVQEAKLYLYYSYQRNTGAVGMTHRANAVPILKEWAQGTGTGVDGRVALDGEVTWQSAMRNTGDLWQNWDSPDIDNFCGLDPLRSGGAYGPEDVDLDYAVEGSEYGDDLLVGPTWVEWDVTEIINAWASGDLPGNYGFKITQQTAYSPCEWFVQGGYNFVSSENADVEFRPLLVVIPGEGPTGKRVFTGDVNNDGAANIADAIALLGFLFGGGPAPVCFKAADANDDNAANIADAITILGYLFGGGTMTDPEGNTIATGEAGCRTYPAAEVDAIPGGCTVECTP